MDVLICEDNVEQLYALKQLVLQIAAESHLPLNIYLATTRAQSLLTVVKQQCYQPGALFILDVLLDQKQLTGLQLAQILRQKDSLSTIVFCTTHSELAYLTFHYQVAALDYILKDELVINSQRLRHCIEQAYQRQNPLTTASQAAPKTLLLKIGAKLVRIQEDDLIYAETSGNKHRLMIYTTYQQLEVYGSLTKLAQLSPQLMRCHNSYLINKTKIKMFDGRQMRLLLDTGVSCPVSRKYLRAIKMALT